MIRSRTDKPGPGRNILRGCWEGNGFTHALGPELSFLLLVGESLSKYKGNALKEAELSTKPRQALRPLFEFLDLITHELSFTQGLQESIIYFLCQNLTYCSVTLGKLVNLSVFQFPHF